MTLFSFVRSNNEECAKSLKGHVMVIKGKVGEHMIPYDVVTRDWLMESSTITEVCETRNDNGDLKFLIFKTRNSYYTFKVLGQGFTFTR